MSNQINALQHIQQELKAPKSKRNTFGNYNYRNCEDILEAVKPLLKELGATLVLSDDVQEVGQAIVVTAKAVFTDAAGQQTVVTAHAGVDINKKGMDVAQTFGASSSYARKYALNGLFLIDDTKDYDSDEYHNQVNHTSNQNNRNSSSNGQHNAAPQQTNQAAASQPKRTLAQLYNDALKFIPNAPNLEALLKTCEKFKGTQFEPGIKQACRAKTDQMGWG
ncbi:MAG: ERF family protein, partial [Acinetobacter sp.]